jgi:hypothetical protein
MDLFDKVKNISALCKIKIVDAVTVNTGFSSLIAVESREHAFAEAMAVEKSRDPTETATWAFYLI